MEKWKRKKESVERMKLERKEWGMTEGKKERRLKK